jgi:hypothetical protein
MDRCNVEGMFGCKQVAAAHGAAGALMGNQLHITTLGRYGAAMTWHKAAE